MIAEPSLPYGESHRFRESELPRQTSLDVLHDPLQRLIAGRSQKYVKVVRHKYKIVQRVGSVVAIVTEQNDSVTNGARLSQVRDVTK
jgi:hypothetical protein